MISYYRIQDAVREVVQLRGIIMIISPELDQGDGKDEDLACSGARLCPDSLTRLQWSVRAIVEVVQDINHVADGLVGHRVVSQIR